jgi:hypothetical protein
VKLTAAGRTLLKTLDITLDPRVDVSLEELASLLDFQRQVTGVLGRAVALHEEISIANEEARALFCAKVVQYLTQFNPDEATYSVIHTVHM